MSNTLGITHAQFQAQLCNSRNGLAPMLGWKCQYFWRSYHSPKGWPDLFLVHVEKKRAIVAELKVGKDQVTPEQQDWLDALEAVGIPAYVWRDTTPIEEIAEILSADTMGTPE